MKDTVIETTHKTIDSLSDQFNEQVGESWKTDRTRRNACIRQVGDMLTEIKKYSAEEYQQMYDDQVFFLIFQLFQYLI
jgi:hypothetical protein